MQNYCADEACANDLKALGQLAVLLFDPLHVKAHKILEQKRDQDCLTESRDKNVNQDLGPPQIPLLVDHEHLGFPLGVTLLILVDRAIVLCI